MLPEGCRGCCWAVVLIPLLCITFTACAWIYISTNQGDPPLGDFEVNRQQADAFDQEVRRATNQAAAGGFFTFRVFEEQISSWAALEAEEFVSGLGYDFPFENAQIALDPGRMTFYGELIQSGIALPLEVVIVPGIDADGHLDLDIDEASLIGLQLPDWAIRSVTDEIERGLLNSIEDLPGDYQLYDVRVTDETFDMQGVASR